MAITMAITAYSSSVNSKNHRSCGGVRYRMAAAAIIATALAAVLGSPAVPAANVTWNSTSTDMNATSAWTATPSANLGFFAVAGTGTNPTLSSNLTMQSLAFAGTGVSGWTVSGGASTLTLSAATAISGSNTSGTNTISSNINFTNAAPSILQATGGTLVLSGNITGTTVAFGGITTGTNAVIALTGSNSFQTFKFGNSSAGNGATYQFGNNYAIVGSGSWTESSSQTFQAIDRDVNLSGLTNTFFKASTTFGGTQSLTIGGTIGSTVTNLTTVTFTNNIISSKTLSFTAVDLAVTGSAQAKTNFTVAGSGNTSFLGSIFQTSTNAQGITINSTGLTTFSGSNSYSGLTTIGSGATLKLDNANALPSGPLTLNGVLGLGTGNSSFTRASGTVAGQVQWSSGGFAAYGSDATVNIGGANAQITATATSVWSAATADRTVELVNPYSLATGAKMVTVNNGSADVDARFSGIVSGSSGTYTKNGAGTLEFTAANTYSGTVAITAGQLRFSGAGSLSGTTAMVTVNGSDSELKWNSSAALTRQLTMTQGTLSGTGTISAAGGVTIGTTATLSPGNSPGTQAFTTGLTLASGGNYTWEINNWTGTQGAAWDVLAVSGSPLDITATSGSPFTIALTSLNGSNTAGSVPNFNGGSSKTFTIATAGSLTNFDASKFAINTSAFSLYNTYSGSWSITGTGNALQLNYTVGSSVTNGSYSLAASVGASSIIVGGTSSISSVITNAGTGTADTLNYNNMVATYTGGTSSLTGSGAGLAQSASGTATGSFTTNAAGSYTLTPVGTVTNSTLGGAATPAGVVTASVTVYNHSAAALSLVSGSGQTIITGGTFAPITFSLTNAGSQNAPLEVANLINLTGSTGSSVVTANGNASYTATGLSNTAIGVNSLNVSMQAGDQQSLSGASALTTVAAASTNYSVLSHATSSLLGGGSSTSTVLDLGIWDYSTATWSTGTSSASFSIFNLAGGSGDSLTALLALTGTSFSGNSEFSSNLATYSQIAGGGSQAFSVTFDTSGIASPGTYAKTFTINMADQQNLSGAAATNTLIVTANVVVVPEPDTIIFAGIGIAMAGWSIWKRRRIAQIMQVK